MARERQTVQLEICPDCRKYVRIVYAGGDKSRMFGNKCTGISIVATACNQGRVSQSDTLDLWRSIERLDIAFNLEEEKKEQKKPGKKSCRAHRRGAAEKETEPVEHSRSFLGIRFPRNSD